MFELKSKNSLRGVVIFALCALLFFSLFIGVFTVSVIGQSSDGAVRVGTETELKGAIESATSAPIVIALDKEIALSATLSIPANKDITLTSSGNTEFALFGAYGASTITVQNGGTLKLDGITVTHVSGATGCGVTVNSGGTLILSGGKISGNTAASGSGVSNSGNFAMYGGVISGNTVSGGSYGGGVYNTGNFTMFNGVISGNTVSGGSYGGGVYSTNEFSMSGGVISGNSAPYGGGVSNAGRFTLSGGEISSNTASRQGGGVYVSGYNNVIFTMTGGKISRNTVTNTYASSYGGGVYVYGVNFDMSSGEISDNSALYGGGVYSAGNFNMTSGTISNNGATNGSGIYLESGSVRLSGNSRLSGNTASGSGGGVWVSIANLGRLFVSDGVTFSSNRASAAYNRDSLHDTIYSAYIGNNVIWTSPYTQGYNNYDISYTYGASTTTFTVTVIDGYGTPTGAGSYSVGVPVTLNAGTRNGFTFSRWTVSTGGVTLSSATGTTVAFTMPASNVIITASWTPIRYTISYTLNSGSNGAGNPSAYTAENLPVALMNPTRTGYNFMGWTAEYANNTQLNGQYGIPAGSYGNVAFTANWGTANQYAIAYVLNGGTNAANNPTAYAVTDLPRVISAPTKAGYTFRGWTIAYTDSRANITNPVATYSIPSGVTGSITLTANWNLVQYTISYGLNSGTNGANNPTSYSAESTFPIAITNPTKASDEFLGWTVKYANGSQTDVTIPVTSYSIPAGTTGNVALTANWGRRFTVQFVNWDGTLLKSETVLSGGDARPPANPTSEGYVFTGWDGDFTNVTRDLRITALYKPAEVNNNGQNNSSDNVPPSSSNSQPFSLADNTVKDITNAFTIIAGAIAGIYFRITGWLMGLLGF